MDKEFRADTTGSSGYIAVWTLAMVGGALLGFFGRFFAYEANPSGLLIRELPMFVGMFAVVLLLAGYLRLAAALRTRAAMGFRTGVLLLVLGLVIIAAHFAFRQLVPVLLG